MTLIFIADFLMILIVGLVVLLWADYRMDCARIRRKRELYEKMQQCDSDGYYKAMTHYGGRSDFAYKVRGRENGGAWTTKHAGVRDFKRAV
ncbi:MAG: hypothetical protein K6F52_07755 [Clostridia bacterium]|nr:hypothetical protein [Clostridia bacterium]